VEIDRVHQAFFFFENGNSRRCTMLTECFRKISRFLGPTVSDHAA
jgi:hypothetical protein